ncbi:MAG: FxsA family protein [Candidatus Omnitrophota bacterium]
MLIYLILLFTIVPMAELALLLRVGQIIGVFNTLFIVVATGVTGAYLAKLQGLITLQKIQEDVNHGRMPGERLIDGVIIFCSGILLLTPGFITDIIGFMGLVPSTRDVFKQWLKKKLQDKINKGQGIRFTRYKN